MDKKTGITKAKRKLIALATEDFQAALRTDLEGLNSGPEPILESATVEGSILDKTNTTIPKNVDVAPSGQGNKIRNS